MPQPSINNTERLASARDKQLKAKRKMQALPDRQPRTELPNINWHDHYLQRVSRPTDNEGISVLSLMLIADELDIRPDEARAS